MPHSEFSSPPVSLEKLALLQNRHDDTEKAGGTSSSEAGELHVALVWYRLSDLRTHACQMPIARSWWAR